MIRLDKLLANSGIGSRSDVKSYIRHGRVSVDGSVIKDPDLKIDENAQVNFDGMPINYKKFQTHMLNKPAGVISATEDARTGETTVIDLLSDHDKKLGLFPVGRLDKDTTGLLLLTNDGALAHNTLSPKKHVTKTYFAQVKNATSLQQLQDAVDQFKTGITLGDGYTCKSAELRILSFGTLSEIEIDLHEGKYHQVKRMFEAVQMQVVSLKRIAFGGITLDESLQEGSYRELTASELDLISLSS